VSATGGCRWDVSPGLSGSRGSSWTSLQRRKNDVLREQLEEQRALLKHS